MAHIPYGYRIKNGKAMIHEEEAARLRHFFSLYFSGLSIESARQAAGISLSIWTANRILKRKVYLGDAYYPRIIDETAFRQAAEERARRLRRANRRKASPFKEAIPAQTRFSPDLSEDFLGGVSSYINTNLNSDLPPAEKAAALYALIRPYSPDRENVPDSAPAQDLPRRSIAHSSKHPS